MKELSDSYFISHYPKTFKSLKYTECDDGWFSLLNALCVVIESEIDQLPSELQGDFHAVQIKEKFGALRFYMNRTTPIISGAIAMAEHMSYFVCEECGNLGQLHTTGWAKTLCDKHYKKRQKK